MCDQTEIRYLDGDVVWVKLGPCWWPGQVTGVDNLPEDLKVDFNKKPPIAAVKFFQENSYEFVKNIHQIYKYNCTQKDDFIKKGLDKYRTKHKNGSKLMDKFPGDVETAETLTGGDPSILKSEKFSPEEKPDISALFGDKKSPKKKQKSKEAEMTRRSYTISPKLARPRVFRESDHEVRIRHQPRSHPTTPTSGDQNTFSCPLCSFTTTRVNVLICHNKSHREPPVDAGLRHLLSAPKRRSLGDEPQKRKYVRKNKSLPRLKNDRASEPVKRKQKQAEKITKKKKADPEINELLADWDDGSDDMEVDMNKSTPMSSPSAKDRKLEDDEDEDLLKESEQLLKETESLSTHLENSKTKPLEDPLFDEGILKPEPKKPLDDDEEMRESASLSGRLKSSKTKSLNDSGGEAEGLAGLSPIKDIKKKQTLEEESENFSSRLKNSKGKIENDSHPEAGLSLPVVKEKSALSKKLRKSLGERKNSTPENDEEKKSKLSCFDFDDEEPEPAFPPVRKITRVFGEKNTSLKKEIIKEFVLSQALAEEKEAESKANEDSKNEEKLKEESKQMEDDEKLRQDITKTVDEASALVAKIASETERSTELEIVEILEVEREKEAEQMKPDDEKMEESALEPPPEPEIQPEPQPEPEPKTLDNHKSPKRFPSKSPGKSPRKSPSKSPMRSPKKLTPTSSPAKSESLPKDPKDLEDVDTNSGRVTIESEEETLTISQLSNAGSGDGVEMGWNQLNEMTGDKSSTESPSVDSPQPKPAEKPVKRRGRPRKYPLQTDVSGNGDSSTKFEEPQLPGTPDSHETDRKTSESDGERLSTGRRRKPNKKYLESDIYSSSPGRRTPRTDDSQSETEEKEPKVKGRRGRKPSAISKAIRKSLEEYEFSDQTLDSAEEAGVSTPIPKSPVKSPEFTSGRTDVMSPVNITDLLATSDVEIKSQGFGSLETDRELKIVETRVKTSETVAEGREEKQERKIEMLPPKKSQIKKFEMSQIDAQETVSKPEEEPEKEETKVVPVEEMKPEVSNEIVEEERVSEVITTVVHMETEAADGIVENIVEETIENIIIEEVIETKETIVEAVTQEPEGESVEVTIPAVETTESPEQVFEGISEELKVPEEPKVVEEPEAPEEPETPEELNVPEESKVLEEPRAPEEPQAPEEPEVPEEPKAPEEPKLPEEPKVPEEPEVPEQSTLLEIPPILIIDEEIPPEVTPTEVPPPPEEAPNDTSVSLPEQSVPSPAPEPSNSIPSPRECRSPKKSPVKSSPAPSDVSVPVKKREKPRIIENVALREPMQILKSKLLEKQPTKGTKHKLEMETSSKNEIGGNPRTKIMKLDPSKSNSSPRNPGVSLTKKLQVLKVGEALELQQDKLNLNTISISSSGASDSSEVEFDINSIPFVMSEDLTPENIEQMPMMMSSIISNPSSSVMTTALTLATATPQITSNQMQFKPAMTVTETITPEKAPAKKKTASPTILKAKPKAKPTITSIKTLVPPLTGGVKGLKFQGQQGTKTMPVLATPKGSPGKYVIVQTGIGGQPVRHTVQGTIAMPQKMPIPSAKATPGNVQPQIVQQGNKVVILTSPTSGQTKMVPLAVQKTITTGKVQKLMTTKGQVLGKTIIAPKSDPSSPTTSKITPSGQKIVNTGVLSKGVFTTISGGKAVLGTIPQHFVTAKGVITQINTSQLSGKAVVGQKTYITNKGSFYPISSQGGAKTLLTPISQSSLAGKTIITSAGLVPGKGAVLTPFTGQQVKAMAAKGTPSKGAKIYQQLPMVQKKVPMSPASTVQRVGTIKSPGTIVLQNPPPLHQTAQTPGKVTPKKIIRQTVMSPLSPQPSKSVGPPQPLQRSKSVMAGTPQKGRQAKQKIVIQKVAQETPPRGATTIVKTPVQKTTVSTAVPGTNRIVRGQPTVKNIHQQLSAVPTPAPPVVSTAVVPEAQAEDKKPAVEVSREAKQVEASASTSTTPSEPVKPEEPKVAAPQIMALPTESADGSQTYVLVTIDEQGQIQPLDNNALMSLEGTTPNADGSRTLYIDPSSLDPSGAIDNIVLQFDNTSVSTLPQTTPPEAPQTVSEGFQTSNQDILAAALANTDFQQEIGLPETTVASVMATGITQTSLDTQTILQSTLIPSAEPISSPSVLETSLTLNQPIMTPLEVPSSVGIQSDVTDAAPVSSMASLEIPISISNPEISYIAAPEGILPGNSMPDIGELIETPETPEVQSQPASQYLVMPDMQEGIDRQETTAETPPCTISYAVSIPENVILESGHVQTTPSMPIIDDSFVENVEYSASRQTPPATAEELIKSNSEEEEVQVQEESKPTETSEIIRESTQEVVRDMPIVQTDETDHTSSPNHSGGDDNASKISSCVEEAPASSETKPPETDVESSSAFEAEPAKPEEHSPKVADEPEPMETDSVPEIQVSPPVAQSSQPEPMDVDFEKTEPASQDTVDTIDERPSQSFEKFESLSINNDEVISQSTSKSEGTEATQSSPYESMEMETTVAGEPPTQSFEDARGASGASVSQSSYEGSSENTNAPTQSFNEVRASDEAADDPSFPTQSYEVGNADNLVESLETDAEISQEGNIPSQSNDVGNEGIGTSGFSNNSGLNEDETASSSYVPETPETQERDQDQESAISTSSYEIPPCEDINIATSSVIADTSVDTGSLHDNGVPEIPTSSYNLNPDSSSTHVDAVPTSSFEDQVVVEQNVSTSYEVPISMPRLEGDSAQNFVSESSDQRNEPTSYYARNPEEVTSEASQSYFMPEGPSPSYPTQTVSPSCYEAPPETEASQSYYSTQEIDRTEQSSSRNVEASPSFYHDTTDEVRLRSQGEATPTYTERYPLDYTLDNSPIERHDLVESSVPATKPTER